MATTIEKKNIETAHMISMTLTPTDALTLIKHLSTYAADGRNLNLRVSTENPARWNDDEILPVARIAVGNGFMNQNVELEFVTSNDLTNTDDHIVHYVSEEFQKVYAATQNVVN